VRWPTKSSGAFAFGCPFFCFFLLGNQKKKRNYDDVAKKIVPLADNLFLL
jgi:hypothetical protein